MEDRASARAPQTQRVSSFLPLSVQTFVRPMPRILDNKLPKNRLNGCPSGDSKALQVRITVAAQLGTRIGVACLIKTGLYLKVASRAIILAKLDIRTKNIRTISGGRYGVGLCSSKNLLRYVIRRFDAMV